MRKRNEATLVFLRAGHDWFYPYYRDRALALMLGVTPNRCCWTRWARRPTRLRADGRCLRTGAQPRAAHRHPVLRPPARNFCRRSVRAGLSLSRSGIGRGDAGLGGEGATSEGEFWEALNAACLENLPVVFLIEDNGYAISVPVEKQTAGGNIAQAAVAAFPT